MAGGGGKYEKLFCQHSVKNGLAPTGFELVLLHTRARVQYYSRAIKLNLNECRRRQNKYLRTRRAHGSRNTVHGVIPRCNKYIIIIIIITRYFMSAKM